MIHEKTAKAMLALVFIFSSAIPAFPFSQNPFLRRDFFDLPHTRNGFVTEQKMPLDSALQKSAG
jgi:hypothetical protein